MLSEATYTDRNLGILSPGVLMDTLAIVYAMNVHLPAAVGAVHESGQRRSLAPAVGVATDVPADALDVIERLLIVSLCEGCFPLSDLT